MLSLDFFVHMPTVIPLKAEKKRHVACTCISNESKDAQIVKGGSKRHAKSLNIYLQLKHIWIRFRSGNGKYMSHRECYIFEVYNITVR